MCVPFELRFIGSCVEEMGKHSYQELRQQALFANNLEKLEKDVMFKNQSLYEEAVRHRVLINISLLKSRNYSVANWYSKKFLRTDYIEDLIHKEKDELVQNELLLLFTMASRHPAFSFDQKQFFSSILLQLHNIRDSRFIKQSNTYGYPPGFGYPTDHRKVPDGTSFPINFHVQPPGLPNMEYALPHLRGWPGLHCGAPAEVPPFPPHQPPLQPPQPATSPLVTSPSQSRSTSPHRTPIASRAPALSILTTLAPTVAIPTIAPAGVVPSAPGIPPPGGIPLPAPSVASVPTMIPVPLEALAPPAQLSQSSQPSPIFNSIKPGQPECDELSTNIKEEPPIKPPIINAWLGPPEAKQLNGMRIPPFPQSNIRTSIADHMQAMSLTDENSHYQSSSSNSTPPQSPPDTPSNMSSNTSTPHGPGRGPMEKNRINGMPSFMHPFGDTTSPPPPPAFTFSYGPLPQNRFYSNAAFRPATTTYCQYPYPNQETTTFAPYTIPYISVLYPSCYTPANPLPPRHPPGCYNCGATGHLGQDCTLQNIDEITQKKTYSVDFSPVQSDGGEK